MDDEKSKDILIKATRLNAIAQNGLTFSENPFDKERYIEIQQIAAELTANHSRYQQQEILNTFHLEKGYATPKLDVRGCVFRDDKILLVRESADGLWTLPGGFAEFNYSPAESVVKEVEEESGFLTRATKLLALYDKLKHPHPLAYPHIYKMFILCEIIGGEAKTSIETSEVQFFHRDKLPLENEFSAPRVLLQQIQRMFLHYDNPDWLADFD